MKTRMRIARAKDVNPECGVFVAADHLAQDDLRRSKLKIGREVTIEIKKARNVRFHRLAHAFGQLLVDHCDAFSGYDAHDALKRLQLEANAGCTTTLLDLEGVAVNYRLPRSLSFESMDEIEFEKVIAIMAEYAAPKYLKTTRAELLQMANDLAEGVHDGA